MQSDRLILRRSVVAFKAAGLQQFCEQCRVMLHLIMATKLRILILERVMTMRTRSHNLLRLGPAEGSDIRLRSFLEKKLIPDSAGRIAGAGFLFAQNGEVYSRFPAIVRRWRGQSFGPGDQRSGAAYPEEVFEVRVGLDSRNVESFRPGQALEVRPAIWVTLVANLLQHLRRRTREAAFADQIATQIIDQIDVTNQNRTFLDARLAHGAGPESLIRDGLMHAAAA